MNSRVPRIIGLFILIPIWYYAFNPIVPEQVIFDNIYIRGTLTISAFGFSYSILHRKDYPVQAILTLLVAEFIVHRLKVEDYHGTGMWIYSLNLRVGTLLVLAGEYGSKFFCFVLSPIQNFLRSIGIKATIPVIAGILIIPIGLAGIEFTQWLEEYRRIQRIRNRW